MKKMIGSMGLAMFLALVSGDLSAAECSNGFAELSLKSHDGTRSISQAECADEEVFKGVFRVPAGVPLFLSAIAGLGVVALRGRTTR